jgi:hypothetical protein
MRELLPAEAQALLPPLRLPGLLEPPAPSPAT